MTARVGAGAEQRKKWRFTRLLVVLVLGLVTLAVVCAVLGAVWLRHAMYRQLPALDGQLELPGLSAPVEVRRDEHGVPHIQAANMDDLLQAQGFVVAQDRLWQMDMARRFSAGDLAEILGPALVDHDKLQRILEMRPTAERLTASMPTDQKRLFDDFARGVNAFIARNQDRLPAEFRLLGYRPRPWQPVDSWLVCLNMVQRLDTLYGEKLDREKVQSLLKPDLAGQLYPSTTRHDHPPTQTLPDMAGPLENLPQTPPDELQSPMQSDTPAGAESISSLPRTDDLIRLRKLMSFPDAPCEDCRPGSNEWAVSGAHTESGRALLSNDMHLEHGIPDIWHEEDLEAGSFHVAGVTTPGIPLIIAGHNAHIAWGFTTLNGDVQDVYVEKTNRQGEYWTAQGWRAPEIDREIIHVRGGRDVTLNVEITVHGPVITPLLPHEQRMLALKWTLYNPALGGLPLKDIDAANNWAEFREALSHWWAPTQNIVYADDQGHIGYQAVGVFPFRAGGLNAVPIVETGTPADSEHEWQGWIPFDQLPSVLDPSSGILATANARITADRYPYPLALNWAAPYRNERIWKQLTGKEKLKAADMLALQNDTYSEVDQELAQRFAYAIDHANQPDARLRQAAGLLRSWNGVVGIDSVAAQIVDAAKRALWPLVLEPKLGSSWKLYVWQDKDYAQEEMIAQEPAAWLPAGYKSWNDLLAAAVSKGMADGHAPRRLSHWTYGSQHEIDVRHPIYGLLPFFGRWTSTGLHPLPGDETSVDARQGLIGPSQRFTMDWNKVDGSTENIVMGESGDPVSAYYRDQWPYWYAGKTFALPFTDTAVNAAAKHTLRLLP